MLFADIVVNVVLTHAAKSRRTYVRATQSDVGGWQDGSNGRDMASRAYAGARPAYDGAILVHAGATLTNTGASLAISGATLVQASARRATQS